MQKKVKDIEKYVFEKIGNKALFKFHIKRALFYGKQLAIVKDADMEKVIIAILFHDIDGIINKTKNDFVAGTKIASQILKKYNYSTDFIEEINDCILTHSSASKRRPQNNLQMIVNDADAISHFEMLPLYFFVYKHKENSFKDVLTKVNIKINESWKKILLKESKKIAIPLYQNALNLLRIYNRNV